MFLATDEVSIAFLGAMLRTVGDEMASMLEDKMYVVLEKTARKTTYEANVVPGPSTRNVSMRSGGKGRFQVRNRERWLDSDEGVYGPPVNKSSAPAYPPALLAKGSDKGPKDIDESLGEPTMQHPVNWINAQVALDLAHAIGCRLPTIEEFQVAMQQEDMPLVRSGRWNLRDRSFGLQHAHQIRVAREFKITHYKPGKLSYDGTGGTNPDDWGTDGADRWLWFCQTGVGVDGGFQDGIPFRHLIGNVGEYVLDQENASTWRNMSVMGASALSDPSVMPGDARDAGNERNGYVDVGFRLAIDADDFGSLGMLVDRQLRSSDDSYFVAGDRGCALVSRRVLGVLGVTGAGQSLPRGTASTGKVANESCFSRRAFASA